MMAAGRWRDSLASLRRQPVAQPAGLRCSAMILKLSALLAVLLSAGCSVSGAQLQATVAAQVQLTVAAQVPQAVTVIVMVPVTPTLPPVASRTPRPTATPVPATPQVSAEMPPDPRTGIDVSHTLFAENFNLLGTWEVFDTDRARGTWRQATYVLTLRDTDEIRWVFNGPRAGDFYFEGSAAVGVCKAGDQYGLIVRADNDASFYAFGVACGGRFRLLRSLNGVYEEVLPWQASPLLERLAGSTQRLGVRAVGSRLGLYFNSQLLAQVEDAELAGGRFGFYAGSYLTPELQVTFDDLVAYPILSAAAAAALAAAPTALPIVALPATPEPTATVAASPMRSATPTSATAAVVATVAATATVAVPTATLPVPATPTVVAQLAMEGASAEPVFTEDFQIPNYWDQFSDATTRGQIEDGVYRLTLSNFDSAAWALNGIRRQDFYFSGTASIAQCGTNEGAGLVFRAVNDLNYFAFIISCTGTYKLVEHRNGAVSELLPWTVSGAISRYPAMRNRIGVRVVGALASLYVNDVFLTTVAGVEQRRGRFGVFVKSNASAVVTAEFDDLSAFEIQP